MSESLVRARLLREHRRHEEAVELVREHLARTPDDWVAHFELALNRAEIEGMEELALEDARRAGGLMPDHVSPPALQSRILCKLGRPAEALPLADAALRLGPGEVYAWNSKTIALADLHRNAEAERCARKALALAPDNAHASNLLALILRRRNKLDESLAESKRGLTRDPENAHAFANFGWAALQRLESRQAEDYFKEALRREPGLRYAREGLKQAYRGRSIIYRCILRWTIFMQRHKGKYPMVILLSSAVVASIPSALRGADVEIAIALFIPVLLGLNHLLILGVLVAPGIAHFVILRDPVARLSLDRREIADGYVTAILVFGGFATLLAGAVVHAVELFVLGGTLLAAALPFSQAFTNPTAIFGRAFFSCGVAILALGLFAGSRIFFQASRKELDDVSVFALATAAVITFLIPILFRPIAAGKP